MGKNEEYSDKPLTPITSAPVSLNELGATLTLEQKYTVLEKCGHEGLLDLDDIPDDAQFMIHQIEKLTIRESVSILDNIKKVHKDDSNFPTEDFDLVSELLDMAPLHSNHDEAEERDTVASYHSKDGMKKVQEKNISDDSDPLSQQRDWNFEVRLYAALFGYHSPYPGVRAVSDPYDDPDIPVETIRAYVLGIIWTIIGSFVNELFSHRLPSVSLGGAVVQLLLYPCGMFCHLVLPDWGFTMFGTRVSLNPGPWTIKEQLFATIIYDVSGGTPYVSSNIIVQELDIYYGNKWVNWGYQILLCLSTQFLGFGFAGILRKFVIYPTISVWPTMLPTLALNRALLKPEKKENINGWTISRYNYFFAVFAIIFVYYWVPDYLFQALSYFNWMTWIKPNNFNLAMITGSISGLGFNPIPTFDPNVITTNAPLAFPFFTQLNMYIGAFLAMLIMCALYWSNSKWSAYLPINSNQVFSNTGAVYDVSQILTDNVFDQSKYEVYGPPFYSASNLVIYGTFFAIYPFGIIYITYSEWSSIKYSMSKFYASLKNFRGSQFDGFDDPHCKMMSKYKEVPDWWFFAILLISFVLGIILVEVYRETATPVWGLVFVIVINLVFVIPLTVIESVAGTTFGLNVLAELIIGYALPGKGTALMILKAYGVNIDLQTQNYVSDQKMGHYGKIPPRALFRGQMISTLINAFVSLGTIQFFVSSITDVCTRHQVNKFSCPGETTFFSASVLWGVIGPKKVFNGLYPVLRWCFLIGALLTIPAILFKKYGPRKYTSYFEPTMILVGMLNSGSPYNLSYFTGGFYLSFAVMYYVKKRYLSWWEKYTYLTSAAIEAAIALASIIIFFAVQYHEKDINWWGNLVSFVGVDGGSIGPESLLDPSTAPDGYFGPRLGHFP